MKVQVRTLQNKEASVEIVASETILDVKAKIQISFPQMEASKQVLIHAGKVLVDAKTVGDYPIRENERLVVMTSKKPTPPTPAASSEVAQQSTATAPAASEAAAPPAESSGVKDESSTDTAAATKVEPPTTTAAGGSEAATPQVTPTTADPTATQQPGDYETAASAFYGGSELDVAITQIESMGFPRADVERALRAAFNNPDRAVEYLMNGIPSDLIAEQPPQQAEPPASEPQPPTAPQQLPAVRSTGPTSTPFPAPPAPGTQQQTTTPSSTGGALSALRNHPSFEQMRRAIQANPQLLPQVLATISQQNRRLAELVVENQEEFLQMLSEGSPGDAGGGLGDLEGAVGGGDEGAPRQIQLQLTEDEVQAIERLEALGFPRVVAVQAYIACEKNEELAANYLFDNISDLIDGEDAVDASS